MSSKAQESYTKSSEEKAVKVASNEVVNEPSKVDVQKLMKEIRADVHSEVKELGISDTDTQFLGGEKSQALVYAEELHYLNRNWDNWSHSNDFNSHRKVIGPVVSFSKKIIRKFFWKYLLKDYFESERKFQSNLVRHLNANARYTDSRIKDTFWQILEKIDKDVEGLNKRTDSLVSLTKRAQDEEFQAYEKTLSEVQFKLDSLLESIKEPKLKDKLESSFKPLNKDSGLPLAWQDSISEINSLVEKLNSRLDNNTKK